MGCKPSKLQIQQNGDLFNEDTDARRNFMTGIQASKGRNGLEGNLQIAFGTSRLKRYERVANVDSNAKSKSMS